MAQRHRRPDRGRLDRCHCGSPVGFKRGVYRYRLGLPAGNVSVGDGVYRSIDSGETWEHIGLAESSQIGRILVHPDNPDVVFVAALGHIFGPNRGRGIYRSTDGGRSWEQVLSVSSQAGAVDLSLNPANPRQIFAAIWRAERKPWTMVDGGNESGLYVTGDGGDSWRELTVPDLDNGLPSGVLGRIAVSVSPANPDRVWSLIVTADDKSGLYRSDNGGEQWRHVSQDHRLTTRGWYYTHVHAHPTDPNIVFVNNVYFLRSIDGGTNFDRLRTPHGDNHDLWINPLSPEIMIQANDGGANVSLDGAATWSTQHNQPTAEFYRVTVDNQFPYRVYGAQQDNSTISIPSWASSGLTPQQLWYDVAGGESGHIAVNPDDPDIVYAGNYIGRIDRYDRRSDSSRNVVIYPQMQDGTAPRHLKYRFQWNAPIRISRHHPEVIYHTSNHVHRSRDSGMSWETISPDLTRNEEVKQEIPGGPVQHDHTGVEVFNTIFAFEESPLTAGELWAGADDGLVHLSRDAGASWNEITPAQMEIDSTVNAVSVSHHAPGRAYLAVQRYRMDDFRPYVWKTDDYGQTWTLLTDGHNGIPDDHPIRAVAEDPDRAGLLYAGSEFGLFVSFDDGAHWQSLQLNLPVTPITDLVVHQQDLVVATQGRSFWILDNLTPLHQLSQQIAESASHLFAPRDTYRIQRMARFRGAKGPDQPDRGATIFHWLADEPIEPIQLEILDAGGRSVGTFQSGSDAKSNSEEEPFSASFKKKEQTLPAQRGMNRFVWNLRQDGPDLVEGSWFSLAYTGGYFVLPGSYRVRLTVGDETQEKSFEVLKDPRMTSVSQEDLVAQNELIEEVIASLEEVHTAIRALREVRRQVQDLTGRLERSGYEGPWQEKGVAIEKRLDEIEAELIQTQVETHQDLINHPPRLDDQLAYLYSQVYGAYGRPTAGSYERLEDLRQQIAPKLASLRQIWKTEIDDLNRALKRADVPRVITRQADDD